MLISRAGTDDKSSKALLFLFTNLILSQCLYDKGYKVFPFSRCTFYCIFGATISSEPTQAWTI